MFPVFLYMKMSERILYGSSNYENIISVYDEMRCGSYLIHLNLDSEELKSFKVDKVGTLNEIAPNRVAICYWFNQFVIFDVSSQTVLISSSQQQQLNWGKMAGFFGYGNSIFLNSFEVLFLADYSTD